MEYVVLEYIKKEAKSYFYGIHTVHNRDIEKTGEALSLVGKETNLIQQTKYTKYAAAAVIYGFVVVGILIDLLMIYLTRGKNLTGRIAKIAKYVKGAEKVLKTLNDAGVEIIPPSIAINAGMYYKKQKDGRLALVYEANLNARPLIEVNFKREFDLLDLMKKGIENIQKARHPNDTKAKEKLEKNKKNNNKIIEYFDNLGISVKGSIAVKGEYIFEHNVKCNVLTNTYSITDKLSNGIFTAKDEVLLKSQISFTAKIEGKFKHTFDFDPFQNKIDAKVNVELKGATGIKLKYGHNPNEGLFVTKTLYFSGIQGVYSGSFKNDSWLDILDADEEIKPTPFTLIEPFEVDLFKIQLFKP